MTGNEYQRLAGRTINEGLTPSGQEHHALYGMMGEIGEISSIYQKVYQGHPFDRDHLKKEIGDFFPSLRMYLFREKSPNLTPLKIMLKTFVMKIRELGIKDCGFRVVEYNGQKYDTKTEEIIE